MAVGGWKCLNSPGRGAAKAALFTISGQAGAGLGKREEGEMEKKLQHKLYLRLIAVLCKIFPFEYFPVFICTLHKIPTPLTAELELTAHSPICIEVVILGGSDLMDYLCPWGAHKCGCLSMKIGLS